MSKGKINDNPLLSPHNLKDLKNIKKTRFCKKEIGIYELWKIYSNYIKIILIYYHIIHMFHIIDGCSLFKLMVIAPIVLFVLFLA